MILAKVFEKFCKGSPVCVMVRGCMEYALSESFVNELFERTAVRQYTRELLFSDMVDLLGGVVGQVYPSVGNAYQKQRDRFSVSRVAVYEKLRLTEGPVIRELLVETAGRLSPVVAKLQRRAGRKSLLPGFHTHRSGFGRAVTLSNPLDPFSLVSQTTQGREYSWNGSAYVFAATSNVYTASTRTLATTTPAGRSRSMTLDAKGRLSSLLVGSTLETFGYDAQGRLAGIAHGTRARLFGYDVAGMLSTVRDPLLRTTTFGRDAAGRVTSEAFPNGDTAVLGYDPNGQLASLTPPGRGAYTFTHSPMGRLRDFRAPPVDGGGSNTTSYAYDGDGRLARVTRPDGGSVELGYDAAGRTSLLGPLSLAYSPVNGRLAEAVTSSGDRLALAYDGILPKQVNWSGAVTGQVAWGFDRSMKIVWESVGFDVVNYAYDADGLVTKAGQMLVSRNAGTGTLAGTTLGRVNDQVTYDAFGAPATYLARDNTATLLSTSVTRDALGRVATKAEVAMGQSTSFAYAYDARGRLTDVTRNGAALAQYTYDANGNRTGKTTASGIQVGTYDAQGRLVTYGTTAYTYTANGELATKTDTVTGKTTSYVYDALGNLTHVALPTGFFIDYVIDAAGRRIAKKVNGAVVKQWLYRDSNRLAAELDASGSRVRRFVYADNTIVDKSLLTGALERLGMARSAPLPVEDMARPVYIVTDDGRTLRVVTDALGSLRLVVDTATGAVVQSADYDESGAVVAATGTDVPIGFAGGLYDPDTRLVRFGARDYDPETGRWTAPEPMKTAGYLNLYQYAHGDPVNDGDVDGLAKVDCPDKQVVLDSICGPNGQGEVYCTRRESVVAFEETVAADGVPNAAATDTTARPTATELPSPPNRGSTTTSWGPLNSGVGPAPVNQPPAVSLPVATATVSLPNGLALNPTITDDAALVGVPLQTTWFTQSGPAAAVFGNPSAPATTASFPVGGVYVLTLLVSDGQYSRQASVTVTVLQAPTVTARVALPFIDGAQFVDVTEAAPLVGTATVPVLPPGVTRLTTTWSQLSGPGSTTFSSPSQLSTSAMFSAAGNYVLALTATDGTRSATATVVVRVVQGLASPTLSLGMTTASVTLPSALAVSPTLNDGGLFLLYGEQLETQWQTVSGPADVLFSNPTQAATSLSFPVGGVYVVRLYASNGAFVVSADLTVTAFQAPTVSARSSSATVTLGQSVTLTGTATTPVVMSGLTTVWTQATGPGTATFTSPNALTTAASFTAPGRYVLQLTAVDGMLSSSAQVTVDVVQLNLAPVVSAGANQTIGGMTATLVGTATDDGLPSPLSVSWTVVSGPAAVELATPGQLATTAKFAYPGAYVFRLTATDGEKSASATTSVTVNAPTSSAVPSVFLSGIADDELVSRPTAIRGIVSEGAWALELRLGGRDDVDTAYSVLASGVGPAPNGVLGTLDPTLLLNGTYTVRLSAKTSAGAAETTLAVGVDGRMKIGNFTLSFVDLEVPVGTLPIQLVRTYDSRDKRLGDFGVGWNLGIRNVRVEKSGKTGAYWRYRVVDGFFPQYCLEAAKASSVTVTFPTGRQYRFRPKASPECQFLQPVTLPDVVWENTSDPGNPTIKLVSSGGAAVQATTFQGQIRLENLSDFTTYDPRQFTLTTEDGSAWAIDQDTGVQRMLDRNGNTLTIQADGIFHSAGPSVPFTRDSLGRISKLTDPSGQAMRYTFDGKGDLVTFADRAANATQFTYVSRHLVEDIFDPLGRRAVRNDYDTAGRLVSTTDVFGRITLFDHRLDQSLERVTDRLGRVTQYRYNDMGDVTLRIDPTGASWASTYDRQGNTLSATDPLGNTTVSTFDGSQNELSTTNPLGQITRRTFNGFRQVLRETDPLGNTMVNGYDTIGNLTSMTDAVGSVTRYLYDRPGNRVLETDAAGNVTRNEYDSAGRMVKTTDAVGTVRTYTYDAKGKQISSAVVRGGQTLLTTHAYDALGRVVTTTHPDNAVERTTYTATGKVATRVDALGRVSQYAYDAADRLLTTTRPDGAVTASTYDEEGQRTGSTDAAGYTTTTAYDLAGRPPVVTFADGRTVLTGYDAAGRATQMTDETGAVTRTEFDGLGRAVANVDALGRRTVTVFDVAGNVVDSVDALGRHTRMTYDAARRAVATTYADNAVDAVAYDVLGRAVTKTDPLGRTTQFGFDAVGRLTRVTDALGGVTAYGYNEVGERVSQTDANGHVTGFAYDTRGREVRRTLPDGAFETMGYNAAGEKVSRTDFMGRTTGYGYDATGRLVLRTYPDGTTVGVGYTPDGHRASVTDARGTTTYAYDARRRLTQTVYPDGRQLAVGYDARGARSSLSAVVGGTTYTTATGYDAAGRPVSVTDPLGRGTVLSYDEVGNRVGVTYPNTVATQATYDARNRLKELRTPTVASHVYSVDIAGRRTGVVEGSGVVRAYGYDGLDRLTSEGVTGGPTYGNAFGYDAVGNRVLQNGVPATFDTRDRLLGGDTYDANGNTLSKTGEATYTWDFDNRLSSAAMADGTVVSHVYDADGNRVRTTVTPAGGAPQVTEYLVDVGGGLSQVVAETAGSGSSIYVRVGDELLAVVRPSGATRWVHADGIGSVRVLTDEAGVTTDTRAYEAFGTRNATAGTDALAYGFAGEPLDGVTGLAYHRARWMDSRAGRFFGMDPWAGGIKSPATLHRYLYATNSPVQYADPTGEFSTAVAITVSLVAIGATISVATPTSDFHLVANGTIWANLRSRPVVGHESVDHLYIEYVNRSQHERLVFEAKGDERRHPGAPHGYLYGLAARPWGEARHDKGAPGVKPAAYETERNGFSPLLGVSLDTKTCLERRTAFWNTQNVDYHPTGPNSNSWAVQICKDCRLTFLTLPPGNIWGERAPLE